MLFSTLAGVLAGFAFFALIFILTGMQEKELREPKQSRLKRAKDEAVSEENHIVVSLTCTFLSLVLATVLYGVISAEQREALIGGRASSELILSGIAFAFAVISLLYSIMLLVSSVGLAVTAHEVRAIVALLVPPMATLFIGFACQDLAYAHLAASERILAGRRYCYTSYFYERISQAAWIAPLVVFGVCIIMVILSRTLLPVGSNSLPRGTKWYTRNFVPKSSLVAALTAAIWSAKWEEARPFDSLSNVSVWFCLIAAAVVLSTQAVFLIWSDASTPVLRSRTS